MANAIVAVLLLFLGACGQPTEQTLPQDLSDPAARWPAYDLAAPPVPQPIKLPAPVIVADQPWETLGLVGVNSVPLDMGDHIRLYYRYWSDRKVRHIAIAKSYDRINFTKPILEDGTNTVLYNVPSFSVLHDGTFIGAGRTTIGESADGLEWDTTRWNVYPNDTLTSLVKFKGKYIAFVRNWVQRDGIPIREVAVTTSDDFETWTPKETLVNPADPDVQPYGLSVSVYEDKLIGLLWWFHIDRDKGAGCGTVDAELVWSEDGENWHRTRRPFIGPSLPFDSHGTYPAPIFIKDGVTYIYYTAASVGHCEPNDPPHSWTIGLATLPLSDLEAMMQ